MPLDHKDIVHIELIVLEAQVTWTHFFFKVALLILSNF